jgi:hypothetical protein
MAVSDIFDNGLGVLLKEQGSLKNLDFGGSKIYIGIPKRP